MGKTTKRLLRDVRTAVFCRGRSFGRAAFPIDQGRIRMGTVYRDRAPTGRRTVLRFYSGKVIENVVTPFSTLSARIRPPSRSTIDLAIDSPSP